MVTPHSNSTLHEYHRRLCPKQKYRIIFVRAIHPIRKSDPPFSKFDLEHTFATLNNTYARIPGNTAVEGGGEKKKNRINISIG
jgi:hypothetical protein